MKSQKIPSLRIQQLSKISTNMEHQSERLKLELEALRERISDKIRHIVLTHQKYTKRIEPIAYKKNLIKESLWVCVTKP